MIHACPGEPSNGGPDGIDRDPQFGSEHRVRFPRVAPSRINHLLGCQLPLALSAGERAALQSHVRHVVSVGAEKQVIGAHALGVVAIVADEQPVRDGSVCQEPREAVRAPVAASEMGCTVPLRGELPLPDPTMIALFDLRPEPLSFGVSHLSVCHPPTPGAM